MKLFINDLTVMDFSFLDAESGLIGDSLIVDIILEGDLNAESMVCLLYTSDAADDLLCVDLGGRRILKKKNRENT